MGEETGGTPVYDLTSHNWGYDNAEAQDSLFLFTFVFLIVLALALNSFAHRYHISVMPEACIVLTVGLIAGAITKAMLGFNNSLFFLALLPPIIFNSGWQLHPRWLFGLFTPILALSIVGTFTSAVFVGIVLRLASAGGLAPAGLTFAETLTFGALISATDPVSVLAVFTELRVDPKMFYLVFGESVLNDAVGIVLFDTFAKYVGYTHSFMTLVVSLVDFVTIFVGSMALGAVCGLGAAWLLKVLRARDVGDAAACAAARQHQLAVVVCAVWFPTFLSYICELSGIVVTLFAAVGMRHWGLPNLQTSPGEADDGEAAAFVDMILATLAHLGDTIVFLYLGLSVPANAKEWKENYSHSLVIWSLLACVAGRALHVYPICFINNHFFTAVDPEEPYNSDDDGAAPLSMSMMPPDLERDRDHPPPGGGGSAQRLSPEERRRQKEIPPAHAHMLFFAGLRGAVAFSCAHIFPNAKGNRGTFAVTTTMIIIISMYLLGALTLPALNFFGIARGIDVERDVNPNTKAGAAPSTSRFWGALRRLDDWIYPAVTVRNNNNNNNNNTSPRSPSSSNTTTTTTTSQKNDMLNRLPSTDLHEVELVDLANVE